MNAVKVPAGKEMPRTGAFESRIATRVGRFAISTQLLPSAPPEKDDFCQFSGVVTARLTVPGQDCGGGAIP